MNINDHVGGADKSRRHIVRDHFGNRALCIAGEAAVHIAAVDR